MTNLQITAIVGSLRAESTHRALMTAAVELMPAGSVLVESDVRGLPFYNGDVEAAGDPSTVADLKAAVGAADGLVIFTPEYNRSIPAVTKNAVDWLSRPRGSSALTGTPVGIVAATPGGHDVAGVRDHLAATVGVTGAEVFDRSLGMGGIFDLIGDDGRVVDDEARATLRAWLGAFVEFVERARISRLAEAG